MSVWYDKRRNGAVDKYLKTCHDEGMLPCFKGYSQYEMLWDKGFMVPYLSVIRLKCSDTEDQHYLVIDRDVIEGIQANRHSGKQGQHDPKKILSKGAPYWEVNGLKRK